MYNPNLSYTLDAITTLLDKPVPFWVRWTLRLYKRALERGMGR
jgi:hypothetical protein